MSTVTTRGSEDLNFAFALISPVNLSAVRASKIIRWEAFGPVNRTVAGRRVISAVAEEAIGNRRQKRAILRILDICDFK